MRNLKLNFCLVVVGQSGAPLACAQTSLRCIFVKPACILGALAEKLVSQFLKMIFSTPTYAERVRNFSSLYMCEGPVGLAFSMREFERLSTILVRFSPISTVTGAVINNR